MGRRVGVYGGGFDPVHIGHLVLAQYALESLPLERVLFVPSGGVAYYKPGQHPVSGADRLEMLKRAVDGLPGFEICEHEIAQGRFCYTIDTLRHLRNEYPAGTELILLVGGDWKDKIPTWKEGDKLVREFSVAIFPRPGFPLVDEPSGKGETPSESHQYLFDMPTIDISSTLIRERVRQGLPIRFMVPEAVEAHIREKGLYRE